MRYALPTSALRRSWHYAGRIDTDTVKTVHFGGFEDEEEEEEDGEASSYYLL